MFNVLQDVLQMLVRCVELNRDWDELLNLLWNEVLQAEGLCLKEETQSGE